MNVPLQRRLALAACLFLHRVLPAELRIWAAAIRQEIAEIPDDGAALRFALGSLWGLAPRAAAMQVRNAWARLFGNHANVSGGAIHMTIFNDWLHRPRSVGLVSAFGAVALGLLYMAIAGAPMGYIAINAGAFLIGSMVLTLLGGIKGTGVAMAGAASLISALALLVTALLGDRVDGAARWVDLGSLFVQPSLILLPVMVVGFVRSANMGSLAGLLIAAAALAIQPDRAMAGLLMVGLAALVVFHRSRLTVFALIGSAIGFAVTLAQGDTLPAVPFVDQILYSSFDVSVTAGLAVLGGSVLLVIPAIVGWIYDADNRAIYAVFGAVWFAAIAAAALGNYPTPVVGYSGAAVLGYMLSLITLPKIAHARRKADWVSIKNSGANMPNEKNLRIAAGYAG